VLVGFWDNRPIQRNNCNVRFILFNFISSSSKDVIIANSCLYNKCSNLLQFFPEPNALFMFTKSVDRTYASFPAVATMKEKCVFLFVISITDLVVGFLESIFIVVGGIFKFFAIKSPALRVSF